MNNINDLGNKEIFAKNLQHYLDIKNIDRPKLCRDLDIPPTTLSDWINAKKYPRIDKIEMLANYFNVQKSDLIENKGTNTFDELELLFSKTKDVLTDDDRDMIRFVIEKRKKEIDRQLGEE